MSFNRYDDLFVAKAKVNFWQLIRAVLRANI